MDGTRISTSRHRQFGGKPTAEKGCEFSLIAGWGWGGSFSDLRTLMPRGGAPRAMDAINALDLGDQGGEAPRL